MRKTFPSPTLAPMTRALVFAALLLVIPACSPQVEQERPEGSAVPTCGPPPSPAVTQTVDGFLTPAGTIIISTESEGILVTVRGYIEKTPVEVREEIESSGLTILQIEDEGFEAEALISDGTHRNFVKAELSCVGRSSILSVIAPESAGEQLPAPAGKSGD